MSSEDKDENEKTAKKPKGRKHRVTGFEEWGGYMASKKMKLAAQFAGQQDMAVADPDDDFKSDLFKGISIFVNGYTKPSADELKRLMLIHGGTYHHYYSPARTTYTIASNLPYSKIKNLRQQIVLKPDWVTESIKVRKLLPYQDFLLFTPEVLQKQSRLQFGNKSRMKHLAEEPSNCNTFNENTNTSTSPHNSSDENDSLPCEISRNLIHNVNAQHEASDSGSPCINSVSKSSSDNIDVLNSISTFDRRPNSLGAQITSLSDTIRMQCKTSSQQSENLTVHVDEKSKNLFTNCDAESKSSSAYVNVQLSDIVVEQSESSFIDCDDQSKSSYAHVKAQLSDIVNQQSKNLSTDYDAQSKRSSASGDGQAKSSSYAHVPLSDIVIEQSKSSFIDCDARSKSSYAHVKAQLSDIVNQQSKNLSTDCDAQSRSSSASGDGQAKSSSDVISPSKIDGQVTAGHPAFLSEFYSHSRLHHISTAGQELKRYVQSLVDDHSPKTFPGRENLKNLVRNGGLRSLQGDCAAVEASERGPQRVVMHLDMDCFFVSVGLRNHPELKGQPIAVTHSKGKRGGAQKGSDVHYEAAHYRNQSKKKVEGLTSVEHDLSNAEEDFGEKQRVSKHSKEYGSLSEIASCSYEARKAGVRNGMFLGEALRRCPNLKTIPYDFDGYSRVSKQMYDIVASYTLDIEAVSCDELFIDCTELLRDVGISPLQFASVIRAEINEKTNCTASAGLGANMLLARLANRAAKPNGQYYVANDEIEEFMKNQKVKDLPGIGYSTSVKLEQMGVVLCDDLQQWSLPKLQKEFGPKTGQTFFKRCRGRDDRIVQLQKERKSVSAEINYGIRFEKEEEVFKFLKELSVEVVNRLRNINCKGKCITLKLMVRRPDAPVQTAKFMGHGVCDHVAKSVSLRSATDDAILIGRECCTLAKSLKIKPEDYRGIGVQLSKLESPNNDTKGSIESFASAGARKDEIEKDANREIFAPKDLEPAEKPRGFSIRSFLTEKHSPIGKQQRFEHPPPSIDQIDQSVLNALPQDLQKEVLESYGRRTTRNASSTRDSSPLLSRSGVSAAKPKPNKAPKRSDSQVKNEMASKQNTLLDCMVSAKRPSDEDKDASVAIFKNRATIGGAETISEIRSLIKEWVLSSQVVLEEDIDQFRDFLLQVIDEDLKKVDLILKYFHRVAGTANTVWRQAYLTTLSYVQQKMLQNYGTMLDARSEFAT